MKPHPTRALIKSDATDIQDFRGFLVHIMVQIAAKSKKSTFKRHYNTPSYNTETHRLIEWIESTGALTKAAFIDFFH